MATVGTVLVSGGGVYPHLSAGTRTIKINCSALLSDTECGAVVDALKANMPAGSKRIDLSVPPAILAQLASCKGWLDVALRLRYVLVIAPRAVDYDMTANVLRCAGAVAPVELEVDLIALMQNRINEISRLFAVAQSKIPLLLYTSFNSAFVHFAYDVVKTRAVEANVEVFDKTLFVNAGGFCNPAPNEADAYQVFATFKYPKRKDVEKSWSFTTEDVENYDSKVKAVALQATNTGYLLEETPTHDAKYLPFAVETLKKMLLTCDEIASDSAVRMAVKVNGNTVTTFYTDKTKSGFYEVIDNEKVARQKLKNSYNRWYFYNPNASFKLSKSTSAKTTGPFGNGKTPLYRLEAYFKDKKARNVFISGPAYEKIYATSSSFTGSFIHYLLAKTYYEHTLQKDKNLHGILVEQLGMAKGVNEFEIPRWKDNTKMYFPLDGDRLKDIPSAILSTKDWYTWVHGDDYDRMRSLYPSFAEQFNFPAQIDAAFARPDFMIYDDDNFAAMPSRPAKTIRAGAA